MRWAQRLRSVGSEPDPRYTLANERTFLAWVRTALALVAAGVALQAFVGRLVLPGLRQALAATLFALGGLVSAIAFHRWLRVERSLRSAEPLPLPVLAPVLGYAVAAAALVALVVVLLDRT